MAAKERREGEEKSRGGGEEEGRRSGGGVEEEGRSCCYSYKFRRGTPHSGIPDGQKFHQKLQALRQVK